jgi:hypothetical protein
LEAKLRRTTKKRFLVGVNREWKEIVKPPFDVPGFGLHDTTYGRQDVLEIR